MSLITAPRVEVRLESQALAPAIADALISLRVQQMLSVPTLCELVFADDSAATAFRLGAPISVALGDTGEDLFSGSVTAVAYERGTDQDVVVKIRSYDRLHQLRNRQSVRDFVSLSSREVLSKIAAEAGLSIKMETTGPLWQRLVQFRQSDLEFLQEIARRTGHYFYLSGSQLRFVTTAGQGPTIPLLLGETLLAARFEANSNKACRSVRVDGWDPWLTAQHQAETDTPHTRRSEHLAGDAAGRALRRFGLALQSVEQAQAIAQAELDLRGANEVTMHATAEGNPGLCPGRRVEARGSADGFNGTYVLASVIHTLDPTSGYLTTVDSAFPDTTAQPASADVTVAQVMRVDDPKALGRVKVRLSCYDDIETDWLEVLLPAAGRNKGLIAVPEVDDTVLVLMAGGDPAQGIVLGGLFGTTAPEDTGVDGNRVKRLLLRTPAGQQLTLEDADDCIRLEHSSGAHIELTAREARVEGADGSFVTLTRTGSTFHSAGDLTITAPGKRIKIAAAAIDFEKA